MSRRMIELSARLMAAGVPDESEPNMISTVAVVSDGMLLMGQRNDNGKWTVPGGHAEPGESPLQTAMRELKEEAGLDAPSMEPIGQEVIDSDKSRPPLHVTAFRFAVPEGRQADLLVHGDPDGEVSQWVWIPIHGGLPDYVIDALHVPLERNILMKSLGVGAQRDQGEAAPVALTAAAHTAKLLAAATGGDAEEEDDEESDVEDEHPKVGGGASGEGDEDGENEEGGKEQDADPHYSLPGKKPEGELNKSPEEFLDPDADGRGSMDPAHQRAAAEAQNRAAGGDPGVDGDQQVLDDMKANPLVEAFEKAFKKFLGEKKGKEAA